MPDPATLRALAARAEAGGDDALRPVAVGEQFGRLLIMERVRAPDGSRFRWRCTCECGSVREYLSYDIRRGKVVSCGCLRNEQSRARALMRNGPTVIPDHLRNIYHTWKSAKRRVTNPTAKGYHNYGGRGINMAPEFFNDFEAFCRELGPRPSSAHSVDRIDNSRGYEPGNLRWATQTMQMRNRRGLRLNLESAREIRSLAPGMRNADLARRFGVSSTTIEKILAGRIWKESDTALAAAAEARDGQ